MQTAQVRSNMGIRQAEINRTLFISKARNGKGQGLGADLYFDPRTLREMLEAVGENIRGVWQHVERGGEMIELADAHKEEPL